MWQGLCFHLGAIKCPVFEHERRLSNQVFFRSCAAFFPSSSPPLIGISHLILRICPPSSLSSSITELLSVWRLKWEISAHIYRGHVERSWQQLHPTLPLSLSLSHTHTCTHAHTALNKAMSLAPTALGFRNRLFDSPLSPLFNGSASSIFSSISFPFTPPFLT